MIDCDRLLDRQSIVGGSWVGDLVDTAEYAADGVYPGLCFLKEPPDANQDVLTVIHPEYDRVIEDHECNDYSVVSGPADEV